MKTRRLLALVLCFVMLFSDAASTFASTTSGETVVVTDTDLPDTDVTSTEETSAEEEDLSVQITEGLLTEKSANMEVAEVTEVMMEEVVTDLVEELEPEQNLSVTEVVTAYYQENNVLVAELGTFTNFEEAITAINDYLALNPESTGICIWMC